MGVVLACLVMPRRALFWQTGVGRRITQKMRRSFEYCAVMEAELVKVSVCEMRILRRTFVQLRRSYE